MSLVRRFVMLLLYADLIYMTYFYSQVSVPMFIIHLILLATYTICMGLILSNVHVTGRFMYYTYIAAVGICCGCLAFLMYVNLMFALYTYPLYPLIQFVIYGVVLGMLLQSLLKVKPIYVMRRSRRKYWNIC